MKKPKPKLFPSYITEEQVFNILAEVIQQRYSKPLFALQERCDKAEARAASVEKRLATCEARLAQGVGVRVIMEGRA